jgi:hypothetical protein
MGTSGVSAMELAHDPEIKKRLAQMQRAALSDGADLDFRRLDSKWVEITPAMATAFLGRNTHNRNLRSTTVAAYARDMKAGAWTRHHQGIAFDVTGTLMDGQHRLAALVEAQVTLPMLVTTGLPVQGAGGQTTQDTVDRGAGRSVADALALSHDMKNANVTVSAAVSLLMLAGGPEVCGCKAICKTSVALVLHVMDHWKAGVTYAVQNRSSMAGIRAAAVLGAVAFVHRRFPDETVKFYTRLVTGENLSGTSPILLLRNHLMAEPNWCSRGSRLQKLESAEVIVQVFDAWRLGKAMKQLRHDPTIAEEYRLAMKAPVKKLLEVVR